MKFIFTFISVLVMSGCTQTYLLKLDPQSHYGYPNSNVIPLTHVKGTVSETSFFTPPFVTASIQHAAIYKALSAAPEADLLVNSFHFVDMTDFLFIHTLTYRVEGTAAKMEVGITRQH